MWDSLEAVRAFAGDDVERARYYPEDDPFLVEKEPLIAHYDVPTPPPPTWPSPLLHIWRGWTTPAEAEAYQNLLQAEILPGMRPVTSRATAAPRSSAARGPRRSSS